jgi:hypothetical protein
MYKAEMDRLNKKINEEKITQRSKRALHDLVEEFFSVNYQNISEEWKDEVKLNFELRCNESIARIDTIDLVKVRRMFDRVKTSLFTILDKSVDKTRKSKLENNTENQSRGILVIRGVIRGIPHFGDAIDALIFGKS